MNNLVLIKFKNWSMSPAETT